MNENRPPLGSTQTDADQKRNALMIPAIFVNNVQTMLLDTSIFRLTFYEGAEGASIPRCAIAFSEADGVALADAIQHLVRLRNGQRANAS